MTPEAKISKAFEPFLAESGPNDRRDAIVIYRPPDLERPTLRGRLHALKKRLEYVKVLAAAQAPIQERLFEDYRRASTKQLPAKAELSLFPVGGNTLPVATVEVTRKTLPALAQQRDVVAVLPNQRIHLIRPKEVDYSVLGRQEVKDKVTWGLKQLDIHKLWQTTKTKGKNITVAVLDTGVHAEHPALAGRVKNFVVTPWALNSAPSKSPRTAPGAATCIARS